MRPRDFCSDVEVRAEGLGLRTAISAKEGLKKLLQDNRLNRGAVVRDA